MITRDQVILIGTFAKPFGTQGQLLCRTTTSFSVAVLQRSGLTAEGGLFIILSINNLLVPFRVVDFSYHGEDILFTLKDINTEAKARSLTGYEVYMLREDVSEDAQDEMLWTDFVGWQVVDTDQGTLGTITDIDDSTENILATLNSTLSTLNLMIPLHEDFILSMDEQKRILTITLPFIIE